MIQALREALRGLRPLGAVARSPYHNVLVMRAQDPVALLEAIEKKTEAEPALYDAISRAAPALENFDFQSPQDFLDGAKSTLLKWLPALAGKSFHVRFHRRGPVLDLSTSDTERLLDDALLAAAEEAGKPSRIAFEDPDAVIAIDTVDDRAGVGFWELCMNLGDGLG
jgi:tRNA(Ser,Leu) C12 N-acetylase TAN1